MAEHALIDGYVGELRRVLRRHRDAADLADEVADHLLSNVRAWQDRGVDPDDAQRRSLAAFGDPELIARTYAVERRRGLEVPTRLTRAAGRLLFAAGAAWMWGLLLLLSSGVADRSRPWEGLPVTLYALGAWPLWVGSFAMCVGLVGVYRRHGGGGWVPIVALVLVALGALTSIAPWLLLGWVPALAAGGALFGLWLRQEGLAPRAAADAIVVGPTVGLCVVVVVGATIGADPTGLSGAPRLIADAVIFAGMAVFAAGIVALGRWLAVERPIDDPTQALVA